MKIEGLALKETYDQIIDTIAFPIEEDLDMYHCNSYQKWQNCCSFYQVSENVLVWVETLSLLRYWIISYLFQTMSAMNSFKLETSNSKNYVTIALAWVLQKQALGQRFC